VAPIVDGTQSCVLSYCDDWYYTSMIWDTLDSQTQPIRHHHIMSLHTTAYKTRPMHTWRHMCLVLHSSIASAWATLAAAKFASYLLVRPHRVSM